jgi:putative transposase
VSLRALRRWVKRYRAHGLSGLKRKARGDLGQRRSIPHTLQQVIEGLALQKPRRTVANIRREAQRICRDQNWPLPSYSTVRRIVGTLDPALTTLAHEGLKAYQEAFDLIYRHQTLAPNERWQADHSLLPILVRNEAGKPERPWLTVILDEYSGAIPGYFLGFTSPSAAQTALILHQAIWRKTDPRWGICGIPTQFYTDNGSDFTSSHLEQVAADLKMALMFSWPGQPRGRGKIERFFRTVEQLLLPGLPGFVGENGKTEGAYLTIPAFDACFRSWLLDDYHERVHEETGQAPKTRWEQGGFLPRLPESLEQLDLLLLEEAKQRRVQQDGIRFQGQRYFDVNLAAYVGEDVLIRYDPRDLAVIRVFFHNDRFVCSAVCPELAGTQISLKEVLQARRLRRMHVRQGITDRLSALTARQGGMEADPALPARKPASRLKRYYNE